MSDKEIYTKFIEWLNQTWWELPDSEELMPMIAAGYSPEEAELLTGMPFSGRYLEELAELKGAEPNDLRARLDDLAKRGVVFRTVKSDRVRYSLNDSYFVFLRSMFWPGRDDDRLRTVAPRINRYYRDGFAEPYNEVETKGLRALPIKQTIRDTRQVLPYEDVASVLESQQRFAVSTCACRHRKSLDPNESPCKHPTENCLHFGRLAEYIVEQDLGRKISRQEAHDILVEAADSGLVHGISNWQDGVDTICNCCQCCCLWFEAFHVLGHTKSIDASNYLIRTNDETCSGCGLCVKRCPMDALRLESTARANNKKGKMAVISPELCIGCGVCAYKCPTESLELISREETIDPPATIRDNVKRFIAERAAFKAGKQEGN
ncbi:ATP-binding protein [Thermodesulfobacteriota bacterium]